MYFKKYGMYCYYGYYAGMKSPLVSDITNNEAILQIIFNITSVLT